jgi:hypothetical protein
MHTFPLGTIAPINLSLSSELSLAQLNIPSIDKQDKEQEEEKKRERERKREGKDDNNQNHDSERVGIMYDV